MHIGCECGKIQGNEILAAEPKSSYSLCLASSNLYYVARTWRALVWQYADLSIKHATDRFPALGGIARDFGAKRTIREGQAVRPSRYYAGCWEDAMLDDLAWSVHGPEPRPDSWRAPSWSWASIDGRLSYRDVDLFYDEDGDSIESPDSIDFARVVEVNVTPSGSDLYGQLAKGSLTLVGPLLEGRLQYHHDFNKKGERLLKACLEVTGRKSDFAPDHELSTSPGRIEPGSTIFALALKQINENGLGVKQVPEVVWLVLRKVPRGKAYERIGLLVEKVAESNGKENRGSGSLPLLSAFKDLISVQQIRVV